MALTTRQLQRSHILSLNTFPMISGYFTAPQTTPLLGQPGADRHREYEIVVIGEDGGENITGFPLGLGHSIPD